MSIQEAWADLENKGLLHLPHGDMDGACEFCDPIKHYARNLALAAHVDACQEVSQGPAAFTREQISKGMFNEQQEDWLLSEHRCGSGWYCEKAQVIERLGGSDE